MGMLDSWLVELTVNFVLQTRFMVSLLLCIERVNAFVSDHNFHSHFMKSFQAGFFYFLREGK